LILIGDIDESITHSFLSSFADDTGIGKGIKSIYSIEDTEHLQSDLEVLYKWAESNNIKFEVLRYGTVKMTK